MEETEAWAFESSYAAKASEWHRYRQERCLAKAKVLRAVAVILALLFPLSSGKAVTTLLAYYVMASLQLLTAYLGYEERAAKHCLASARWEAARGRMEGGVGFKDVASLLEGQRSIRKEIRRQSPGP